jgi:hypothetical protein
MRKGRFSEAHRGIGQIAWTFLDGPGSQGEIRPRPFQDERRTGEPHYVFARLRVSLQSTSIIIAKATTGYQESRALLERIDGAPYSGLSKKSIFPVRPLPGKAKPRDLTSRGSRQAPLRVRGWGDRCLSGSVNAIRRSAFLPQQAFLSAASDFHLSACRRSAGASTRENSIQAERRCDGRPSAPKVGPRQPIRAARAARWSAGGLFSSPGASRGWFKRATGKMRRG